MKIKEVCSATGLTDKAIRFYISKGLISPDFTENYSGRKSYDFSEEDVKTFSDISTLRKAGFTVEEIRQIIHYPNHTSKIINDLIERKKYEINTSSTVLNRLKTIPLEAQLDLSSLAQTLQAQTEKIPEPDNRLSQKLSEKTDWLKENIFRLIIAASTIVFFIIHIIQLHFNYRYLHIDSDKYIFTIIFYVLFFAPLAISIFRMVIHKNDYHFKYTLLEIFAKSSLTFLLIAFYYLPLMILQLFFPYYSYTENPKNYLEFDSQCTIYKNRELFDVFPLWQPTERTNEKYCYRYIQGFDYSYDVYAEWQLSSKEFEQAINHAQNDCGEYEIITRGSYTCYCFEDIPNVDFDENCPRFDILMFAYNPSTKTVRYICSSSIDYPYATPIIYELEW